MLLEVGKTYNIKRKGKARYLGDVSIAAELYHEFDFTDNIGRIDIPASELQDKVEEISE